MAKKTIGLPRDDRVVHDWLIRFLGEVALPAWAKALHVLLLHFILRGPNFDTCFNTVGGQWTSAIHVPLVEHLFLDLGITTQEVIEALGIRLGTICGEGEIVVLEVQTDPRKINHRFNTDVFQFLGITDSGSLQNEWGAECTARDHDLLSGADNLRLLLLRMEWFHREALNSNCSAVFDDDFINLRVTHEVQILVSPKQHQVRATRVRRRRRIYLIVEWMYA